MATEGKVVVDLTKEESEEKPKKMKQMRLPFSKIDKNVALAKMESEVKKNIEESKKRKLSISSTDDDEKDNKRDADKAEMKSPSVMKVKVKVGSSKKKAKASNSEEKRSPRKRPTMEADNVASPVKKPSLDENDKGEPKNEDEIMEVTEPKKGLTKVSTPSEVEIMEDSLVKSPDSTPIIAKTPKTPKTPSGQIANKTPKTPSGQMANKTPTTPKDSSFSEKNLTPKQLARKLEFEKKREEKEKMKEVARLAREAEKAKKEAEKKEKEAKKEAERKEKEAQKELERLEKEKQKKEKEEEKMKRKKEKEEQKELERKQKEEANKKKQIEKEKQEQQEKAKTEKVKASFANFFIVKKDTESEKQNEATQESVNGLNQFRVKKDMRLAPVTRIQLSQDKKANLDCSINGNLKKSELYISSLRHNKSGHVQGKTWPVSTKRDLEDDIEIIEDEEDDIGDEILDDNKEGKIAIVGKVFKKAKLLQFHDNQRPAYFGTWSKKSSKVGPRRPLGLDSEVFDYDYDSDDDWEEEEQGESLSDEEKDKEDDENEARDEKEEDDDDGFFVGHGVLDKDELKAGDEDDEEEFDEELEIKKQKLKAQQFEEEYKKKKPAKLKPRVFGCFWNDPDSSDKDAEFKIAYDQLIKILNPYKAVVFAHPGNRACIPTSISNPEMSVPESPSNQKGQSDKSSKTKSLKQVPDDAMPDLIRLVHANTNNKVFLAKEFVEFWSKSKEPLQLPKSKVLQKIQEIADYQRSEILSRKCWLVKEQFLKTYGINQPDVPNKWEYILEQPNKASTPSASSSLTVAGALDAKSGAGPECTPKSERINSTTGSNAKGSPALLITRFTKVLSEEDRLKALNVAAEKAEKAKLEAEKVKAEKARLEAEKAKTGSNKGKASADKSKKDAKSSSDKSGNVVNILTPKWKSQTPVKPTLIDLTK